MEMLRNVEDKLISWCNWMFLETVMIGVAKSTKILRFRAVGDDVDCGRRGLW